MMQCASCGEEVEQRCRRVLSCERYRAAEKRYRQRWAAQNVTAQAEPAPARWDDYYRGRELRGNEQSEYRADRAEHFEDY